MSVGGAFAWAQIADAQCVAQHPGLCGDHHHIAAFAVAPVNTVASVSFSRVFVLEGKVEAALAPPPSALSGLGLALVVGPTQASEK